MKRRDLDKQIKQIAKNAGATIYFESGASHDKCFLNGKLLVIPRHTEIAEMLAKRLIKDAHDAIK